MSDKTYRLDEAQAEAYKAGYAHGAADAFEAVRAQLQAAADSVQQQAAQHKDEARVKLEACAKRQSLGPLARLRKTFGVQST